MWFAFLATIQGSPFWILTWVSLKILASPEVLFDIAPQSNTTCSPNPFWAFSNLAPSSPVGWPMDLAWKETCWVLSAPFHILFKLSEKPWPTHTFSEQANQQWVLLEIFWIQKGKEIWEWPLWPHRVWLFCCMPPQHISMRNEQCCSAPHCLVGRQMLAFDWFRFGALLF